jgi:pimeloyl-ACP methyl ester carboxylesterase
MDVLKSLRFILFVIAFLPLFISHSVLADITLLVHGFDSNAMTWQRSGINQYLDRQGWHYKGTLSANGYAVYFLPVFQSVSYQTLTAENKQHLYNANLASRAPLEIQAQQLMAIIQWLNQKHPSEPIYLVGHSSGGLVARYAAVQLFLQQPDNAAPNHIAGLITIASPHLGTARAIQAIDAVESTPFFCPGPGWSFLRSVFGGDDYDLVKNSKALLYELYPANPSSLLFWLNQQPHPVIPYYSVVRSFGGFVGDALVPGYSQDMDNIPALQGKNITLLSYSGHFLSPSDGVIIHEILNILAGTPQTEALTSVTAPPYMTQ